MEIDENLAYFIGVLQSDGCIYTFHDKARGSTRLRLNLTVAKKSLAMSSRFQEILWDYFQRKVNIRKSPSSGLYIIQTSINKISFIEDWKRKIPEVVKCNSSLFGAYIAGMIDGDGYVKYKKRLGQIYACEIRISAGKPLTKLATLIRNHLQCGCNIQMDINERGIGFSVCFLISRKNAKFIREYILPYLRIPYKIDRTQKFCKKKNEPAGIRTPIST